MTLNIWMFRSGKFLILFTGWHLPPGLSEMKRELFEKGSSYNIKDIYFYYFDLYIYAYTCMLVCSCDFRCPWSWSYRPL